MARQINPRRGQKPLPERLLEHRENILANKPRHVVQIVFTADDGTETEYAAEIMPGGDLIVLQKHDAEGRIICLDCGKGVDDDAGRLNWFTLDDGTMVLWRGHRKRCA